MASILWNTVYFDRAVAALGEHGIAVDRQLLSHLSPVPGNTSISPATIHSVNPPSALPSHAFDLYDPLALPIG